MNMYNWIDQQISAKVKTPLPVLSFPGIQKMPGTTVIDLVNNGRLQADCMKIIAERFNTAASVSLMDLSVEAQAFGSSIRFSEEEVPTVAAPLLSDEDSVDALALPKVGAGRTGECVKALSLASQEITERPVLAGTIGPFSLAGRLLDMTEIMVDALTDPEIVHKTLDKCAAFIADYMLAFKKAGANGAVMAEPAAGLLSPALNSEFSVPYVRRIIEAVQDGNFIVVYDNCGNTIPLIDGILATGAKVLHFGNAIRMDEMLPHIPGNVMACGNVDPARE
ncbi:MAG: methyltransferase, partial [Defluviitaleaceae bacterium]|nr:methyltransferase [Defluviitaleaceae bacterium]